MIVKKRETYSINENPIFENGEIIEVDTVLFKSYLKDKKQLYIEGIIVGKRINEQNYRDDWIVDFGFLPFKRAEGWNYQAMVISSIYIVKEKLNWEN